MNIFHSWIDASLSIRLTLTLGHFLWQGLAIAVAAGAMITVLRRASARARYGVLVVALAMMAACPLLTFCVISVPAATGTHPVEQFVKGMVLEDVPSLVPSPEIRPEMLHPSPAAVETTSNAPPAYHELSTSSPPAPSEQPIDWRRFAPLSAAAYLAGVLVLLGRLMLGLHGGRRLCRRSEPIDDLVILDVLAQQVRLLGLRFTPAVAWCRQVAVPVVVGVLRPTILLPLSLATGLAPDQVAAILTHELAHIHRYDHLVDLAQRLIEVFLFFHPAVWWLSRRVRIEREHCCDDLVVSLGATPIHYSESLLRVAELSQLQPGYEPVPGIVGLYAMTRPSRLRQRIARLLGGPAEPQVRLGRAWSLVTAALVVLGTASVFLWNARADLQSSDSVPNETGGGAVELLTETAASDQDRTEAVQEPRPASDDLDAILEAMQSENPEVSKAAIELLSERHGTALLDRLKHDDPNIRAVAATALGKLYPPPEGAVRALAAALNDADYKVCEHAARALGALGPDAREAIPSLLQVLTNDQDFFVEVLTGKQNLRMHAASALGQIRSDPQTVVPALVKAAEWHTGVRVWNVHTTALSALSSFGPDARDAVPVCVKILTETTRQSHNGLRYDAVLLLMEIGADALPSLPGLVRIIQDPHDESRHPAFVALSKMGARAKAAVPVLIEALDRDEDRFWAAWALGGIGPDAQAAVPDLTGIVQAPGGRERAQAALALWQINTQNQLSIPALIEMLKDDSSEVRYRARFALATIGAPARQAAPALVEVMNDSRAIDRVTAALALWRMDWQRDKAIEFLVRELQEGGYRVEAADTLGEIGPAATAAVTALTTAARDRNPGLRIASTRALRKINAEAGGVSRVESSSPQQAPQNTKQEKAQQPPAKYATSKQFGIRRDIAPGLEVPVLSVKVWAEREATVDMGYSTANPRSFLPASVVNQAGAKIVGRIDLEKDDPQSLMFLALSGANRANQRVFDIARIDGWDLGVGPRGGASEVLVLSEGEPKFGMVGTEWARSMRRGDAGFIHAAAGPVLYYGRLNEVADGQSPQVELVPADKLPPDAEDDGWGPEVDGLATRLVMLTKTPVVGQPLKFRLQMKNFGKVERHYDPQNVAPFRVITVKKENGEAEPYIGPQYQTVGGPKPIKPGETVVLWDDYDAAEHFLLAEPEKYFVQSSGAKPIPPLPIPGVREPAQSSIPASNAVTVELAQGKLPEPKAMFVRMREVLPKEKHWRISMTSGVIFFTHSPTNLKKDVTTIQLWFDEKEHPPDYSLGEGENKVPVEKLGRTKNLGFAYMTAPEKAAELWPEFRERIRTQLESGGVADPENVRVRVRDGKLEMTESLSARTERRTSDRSVPASTSVTVGPFHLTELDGRIQVVGPEIAARADVVEIDVRLKRLVLQSVENNSWATLWRWQRPGASLDQTRARTIIYWLDTGQIRIESESEPSPKSKEANAVDPQRDVQQLEGQMRDNPENPAVAQQLARAYRNLGEQLGAKGKATEALEQFRKAQAIQERLLQLDPQSRGLMQDLAKTFHSLGALQISRGQAAEAMDSFHKALAIQERLMQENPESTGLMQELAATYKNLGELTKGKGDQTEALQWQLKAWVLGAHIAKRALAATIPTPWLATGRVTDADGQPMPHIAVRAHCGEGSLRMTGETTTDADGRYELRFGPGIFRALDDKVQLQAATISVHKSGYFERNLHRQGDRLAAYSLEGVEFPVWGKKDKDAVFLPGEPKEINFVVLPTAKASGTLVDKEGKPLAGYRMSLTCAEVPPSSSVLASGGKTDENGRFEFRDIPTGYRFQILIEPPKAEVPWLAWATGPFDFRDPGRRDLMVRSGKIEFTAERFEIQLLGRGVNWREALTQAAGKETVDFRSEAQRELSGAEEGRIESSRLWLVLGANTQGNSDRQAHLQIAATSAGADGGILT